MANEAGVERRMADAMPGRLADRFRFFRGVSGQRHVFTRNEAPFETDDFEAAVVMVVLRDGEGRARAARIACDRLPEGAEAGEVWVHFLAESAAERVAVAVDLAGAVPGDEPLDGAIG